MKIAAKRLYWVDALKGFAILGILLNHYIESFGSFPWFSNPSYKWPELAVRLGSVFPQHGSLAWKAAQTLGWFGDMGPGIFILVSGFTLTLSQLNKNEAHVDLREFYLTRLKRIFPLYLIIHLIILLAGILLKEDPVELNSPRLLLSLLGLRFTTDLFFYINPSWWFIWLIIQLYLVFPFLFRVLSKKGIGVFFLTAFAFTVLSRFAGLMKFTWSSSLEQWMTGSFAGTRLIEFAAGMILARLYFLNKIDFNSFNFKKIFIAGLSIYVLGLISSLFYWTSLISNTLITLGLFGVLISLTRFIYDVFPSSLRIVSWIGVVSFPIFLLHQPLMLWIGDKFSGPLKPGVEAMVLALVFPAGYFIENAIKWFNTLVKQLRKKEITLIMGSLAFLQLLLNISFFLSGNGILYKADAILFILNILFVPLYMLIVNKRPEDPQKVLLLTVLPVSVVFMFILTENWFGLFWIYMVVVFLAFVLVNLIVRHQIAAAASSLLIIALVTFGVEKHLLNNHPVEVSCWGELPALQKDSLSVYSLIPDKHTHLRYNNYDYYVSTNSSGFNGPEFTPGKKAEGEIRILVIGDAFTMPEGLNYEEGYPALLQMRLNERFPLRRITVVNAGVTGFGPNEMLGQLMKTIDTIRPDIYVNQLFINEFEEIDLSREERWNSIGLTPPSMRKKLFSGWQLPSRLSLFLHDSFKDPVYNKYTYNKSLARFYDLHSNLYSEKKLVEVNSYLEKVKSICSSRDCRFLVLYAPGQLEISKPSDVSYYPLNLNLSDTTRFKLSLPCSTYKNLCFQNDISFVDPSQTLRSSVQQPVYFWESWHWNSAGHKAVADLLTDKISVFLGPGL